jgi:WhiB family transcriptional regulator, redox-sensing transcriptional regulator
MGDDGAGGPRRRARGSGMAQPVDAPGDLAWRLAAACRDMDPGIFFPCSGEDQEGAKSVCRGCRVRGECLDYALTTHQDHGIWGGTGERERLRLRRARRRAS